jgi:hypothetical protein
MTIHDHREDARIDNPESPNAMKLQAVVYHAALFLWHHSAGPAGVPYGDRGVGNESIRGTVSVNSRCSLLQH